MTVRGLTPPESGSPYPVSFWFQFLVVVVLGLLATSPGGTASAAEWAAEPLISVKGEYNSNLLLSPTTPGEVYGHWVSPGVRFTGSTESLEIGGRMAADFVRYYGDKDVSLTNLYFPLSVKYKTDRDTIGLDTGLTRDNTLMSELQQTGAVLAFTQRNLWNVNPTWTHALTEKANLITSYQFNDVSYEHGAPAGLADYRVHTVSGGSSYAFTERDQVQGMMVYTNFHVPTVGLTSNIYGAQFSYTHAFDETFTATVSGGPRMLSSSLDSAQASARENSLVWVFGGVLEKKFAHLQVKLDGGREVLPSGFGILLRTDRVGLKIGHQVNEKLLLELLTQGYLVEGITTRNGRNVIPLTSYTTFTPRATWRFSEWWSATVSYSYADQRRIDAPTANDAATGHSTFFMITYFPPKLSFSR